MGARLFSFVIWALVAASVAMWATRLLVQPAPVPAHAEAVGPAAVPAAPLARLFGVPPVAPPVQATEAPAPVVQTQFKLIGVVAPRPGQRNGLALISADDRPPRAVPLGGKVDESMVVQAISHRQVDLGPKGGPVAVTLSLAPLPEASRGVPPSPAGRPVAVPTPLPAAGAYGSQPVMPTIVPPPPTSPPVQPSVQLQPTPDTPAGLPATEPIRSPAMSPGALQR